MACASNLVRSSERDETSSCRLAQKVVRVVDASLLDPTVVREVPPDEPEERGVGCQPYLGPRDVLPVGPERLLLFAASAGPSSRQGS